MMMNVKTYETASYQLETTWVSRGAHAQLECFRFRRLRSRCRPLIVRSLISTKEDSRRRLLRGHLLSNSLFMTFFTDVDWIMTCMKRDSSRSGNHLAVLHNLQVYLNRDALKYRFCDRVLSSF